MFLVPTFRELTLACCVPTNNLVAKAQTQLKACKGKWRESTFSMMTSRNSPLQNLFVDLKCTVLLTENYISAKNILKNTEPGNYSLYK